MVEVASAWVTGSPPPSLGVQLPTNLRAADLTLSADETATVDQASDLGANDYPYGPMGIEQQPESAGG